MAWPSGHSSPALSAFTVFYPLFLWSRHIQPLSDLWMHSPSGNKHMLFSLLEFSSHFFPLPLVYSYSVFKIQIQNYSQGSPSLLLPKTRYPCCILFKSCFLYNIFYLKFYNFLIIWVLYHKSFSPPPALNSIEAYTVSVFAHNYISNTQHSA